jgi:hypothetical protein
MGRFDDLHNPLTTANYDLVHAFADGKRRGAAALAPRLGMPPGTLSNKVAPDNDAHLSPEQWIAAMLASGNFAPLRVAAHQCHHAAFALPDMANVSDMELLDACLKAAREFGDLANAVQAAIADGDVTPAEMRRVQKELIESVAANFELVARLRRLMPEPAP